MNEKDTPENLTPQCISRGGCMRPEECRRQQMCMRPAIPPPGERGGSGTVFACAGCGRPSNSLVGKQVDGAWYCYDCSPARTATVSEPRSISSKRRCKHHQLQRMYDDNDVLLEIWYCPEPGCDFEIRKAVETKSPQAPTYERLHALVFQWQGLVEKAFNTTAIKDCHCERCEEIRKDYAAIMEVQPASGQKASAQCQHLYHEPPLLGSPCLKCGTSYSVNGRP